MAAKDLYEKDFYKVLGVDKKAAADEIKKRYRALARDLHPDKTKGDVAKEEEFKQYPKPTKSCLIQKSAPNTMKLVHYLNAAVFVHQPVVVFKVETSETSSEAETLKIFLLICLVQLLVVADHAKDRIYKLRQQFHFANQYLAQLLIFV
jgi:hypothetical protein